MTEDKPEPTVVTSVPLSKPALSACWAIALGLLGAGGAATFMDKAGAAAASMIALGALLAVFALMGRIPLRLEVAGTKIDASYPTPDQAFQAGRDGGIREGLETAINETQALAASSTGEEVESLQELLDRLSNGLDVAPDLRYRSPSSTRPATPPRATPAAHKADYEGRGWRGPSACSVAGVSYRQLDYWARTGLIEPTMKIEGIRAHRLYSLDDIVVLSTVKRLLDAGISLQQVRTVIERVRQRGYNWHDLTVVSDGQTVYEVTQNDELIDLVSSGKAHFAVSLTAIHEDVARLLRDLPSESTA